MIYEMRHNTVKLVVRILNGQNISQSLIARMDSCMVCKGKNNKTLSFPSQRSLSYVGIVRFVWGGSPCHISAQCTEIVWPHFIERELYSFVCPICNLQLQIIVVRCDNLWISFVKGFIKFQISFM